MQQFSNLFSHDVIAHIKKQSSAKNQKKAIRKLLRQYRRSLNEREQKQASISLLNHLRNFSLFQNARHMAFYFPADGEVNVLPALYNALGRNKKCYLPMLYNSSRPQLYFAPVTRKTKFRADYYGILEPVVPRRLWIKPSQLDVVFMPLVGFDEQGKRVGMGGGFYDASFEFLRYFDRQRPSLVGVAHAAQQVPLELSCDFVESWDVPLKAVVTDKNIFPVNL